MAAELLSRRASEEMIEQLRKSLLAMEKASDEPGNRRRSREAKNQIDDISFSVADDTTGARALRTYQLRLVLISSPAPDTQDKAQKAETRAIVEAIASRNETAANAAYTIHLTNSLQEALRSVDTSRSDKSVAKESNLGNLGNIDDHLTRRTRHPDPQASAWLGLCRALHESG
jgi:DNA-binding GntR family transcriptional regulator